MFTSLMPDTRSQYSGPTNQELIWKALCASVCVCENMDEYVQAKLFPFAPFFISSSFALSKKPRNLLKTNILIMILNVN